MTTVSGMHRISTLLMLGACLVSAPGAADEAPARGTFLVATGEIRGDLFVRTVVLLLSYDETGAMGLVVNRPTDVAPAELMTEPDALSGYSGTLFWGGPVQMSSLWTLVRTDSPPDDAVPVVDDVYQLPFDDAVKQLPMNPERLRLFIGYAGWSPGQLDRELLAGSWHVVRATASLVFSTDPAGTWERLALVQKHRVRSDSPPAENLVRYGDRDAERSMNRPALTSVGSPSATAILPFTMTTSNPSLY